MLLKLPVTVETKQTPPRTLFLLFCTSVNKSMTTDWFGILLLQVRHGTLFDDLYFHHLRRWFNRIYFQISHPNDSVKRREAKVTPGSQLSSDQRSIRGKSIKWKV